MSNGKRLDAPYNFVPLSGFVHLQEGETPDSQDRPFPDGWCGELDIELTALSDLLVSRGTERGAKGPGEARMFELNRPGGARWAIPGSSARGMVRSVVEIATFGKMKPRTDDRRFGVRDLTKSGKFYTSRITQRDYPTGLWNEAKNRYTPVRAFVPLSHTGWLFWSTDDNCWAIQECEYARVSIAYLEKCGIASQIKEPAGWRDLTSFERRDLAQQVGLLRCEAEDPYIEGHASITTSKGVTRTSYLAYAEIDCLEPPTPGALAADRIRGHLVLTNLIKNKNREFFFYNEDKFKRHLIDKAVFRKFVDVNPVTIRGDEGSDTVSAWGRWRAELEAGRIGPGSGREPGIPIFFLMSKPENAHEASQVIAIGLSQMLKLPYDHSIHDMIRHTSEDHKDDAPDMAEAIFGAASDRDDGAGWRGRVTFSHLEGPLAKAAQTAAPARVILNSPKPSFYPAYVDQSRLAEALADNAQKKEEPKEFSTYMAPPTKGPGSEIRGWKRYQVTEAPNPPTDLIYKPAGWDGKGTPPRPRSDAGDKLATRLHPVPGGTTFTGKMHVHNLRPVELGALLWALGLGEGVRGEAGTRRQNHGLGMGKPFGFGRCALRVTGGRLEANVGEDDASRAAVGDRLWQVLEAALRAFEAHMEAQYARAVARRAAAGADVSGGWHDSPQLVALRRLTDPSMHPTPHPYPALIQSGWARQRDGKTCERAEPKNEFVDAKNRGMFLAPAADNRLDRQRFPRKPAEPAKQAVLPAWLDGAQWK